MEPSIFTKIIQGEVPAHYIYEDDRCIVILDAFPAVPGQALVIPREQVDYFVNLDDDTFTHLSLVAKRVAAAADRVFTTARTCLVIEGFEVPHVHIKIYPMTTTNTPLGQLLPAGKPAEPETLAQQAAQLAQALQ